MAIFPLSLDASPVADCRQGVITIGNFDGVHRGHQALLAETVRQAKEINAAAVAVTFDPHPLEILRPESFQPLLTTFPYRAELIQGFGVDHVVILETTSAFLRRGARDFFKKVVQETLAARAIVEGGNFCFGRGREGTVATLSDLSRAAGISLTLVPPQEVEGRLVSSSRVREALLAGDVAAAARLMGRAYRVEGNVEKAQQRGRTIGFPTANLSQTPTLIPGDGVYAGIAYHQGVAWPTAISIGPNPTFGEQGHKVEANLIGYQGNLYGQRLILDFLEKIRAIRKFGDVQELVAQIRQDVKQAEGLVEAHLTTPKGAKAGKSS
jgi:riboflavin kinase/FMN adenylyltransferase